MKKFLAYFDYLGFKQFIENNNFDYVRNYMGHRWRDIELSAGRGMTKDSIHPGRFISDMSGSKLDIVNFSDTVVFCTQDDSEQALIELLEVAYDFNYKTNEHFFPARGEIVYGEFEYVGFNQKHEAGGNYNISSVFGRAVVTAHEKSNNQDWAGCVIDESVIDKIKKQWHGDPAEYLKKYSVVYKVPYKTGESEEFVLRFTSRNINEETFKNLSHSINENFNNHNKSTDDPGIQRKIENTLQYLKSFVD
jgi:hypothetical protein